MSYFCLNEQNIHFCVFRFYLLLYPNEIRDSTDSPWLRLKIRYPPIYYVRQKSDPQSLHLLRVKGSLFGTQNNVAICFEDLEQPVCSSCKVSWFLARRDQLPSQCRLNLQLCHAVASVAQITKPLTTTITTTTVCFKWTILGTDILEVRPGEAIRSPLIATTSCVLRLELVPKPVATQWQEGTSFSVLQLRMLRRSHDFKNASLKFSFNKGGTNAGNWDGASGDTVYCKAFKKGEAHQETLNWQPNASHFQVMVRMQWIKR